MFRPLTFLHGIFPAYICIHLLLVKPLGKEELVLVGEFEENEGGARELERSCSEVPGVVV